MMEKNFKGRVLIDDIYETLKGAICDVMIEKEIDHVKAFKDYGVSRVDLHGLITGRGNKMPLARLFMFAADLGIKVAVTVEKPKNEPARYARVERSKRKDEPDFEPEHGDSEFDDEPVRKPKRKKRT